MNDEQRIELAKEIEQIELKLWRGFFQPHTRNVEMSPHCVPHVMEDIVRCWAGRMAKQAKTDEEKSDAVIMRQVAVMLRTSEYLVAQVTLDLKKLRNRLAGQPEDTP